MYEIDFDPEFQEILEDLRKENPKNYNNIIKKIKDIASTLEWSHNHYKNLEYPLHKFKRVHINKNFVLVFRVNKNENVVEFIDYDHHDNIYKKKRLLTF